MENLCLFGSNFLEKFVGKNILYDPKVAILELIANAWDAGATEVKIIWPTAENEQAFSIHDNGVGMSESELLIRWRTLSYDRIANQGGSILVSNKIRTVFGKNGIGRFAGFCFGESYNVTSCKENEKICYEVQQGFGDAPFKLVKKDATLYALKNSGTKIFVTTAIPKNIHEDDIKSEIGMRFLTDPNFVCYVNGSKVEFSDINQKCILNETIILNNDKSIDIKIIDTNESDKTTKQHGIAWHVNGRLVGEANWKSYGFDEIIDGRTAEAKRHTFIISADFLAENNNVKHDWTGFNLTDEFNLAKDAAFEFIKRHILGQTKQKRKQILEKVKHKNESLIHNLTPQRLERWNNFVEEIQNECPSISENELVKLAGILAKMEQSDTKYSLINQLHTLNPNQIDNLHKILSDWTVDLAKEVLDELQTRLKLLDELKIKVIDTKTQEVQELQPLFHQGLWIFGPEYETIEFTSNEGMTRVIQKLFHKETHGSRNRPDFAIVPDGSVGTYFYPTYDEFGSENGVDRLVLVELKRPGVPISTDEKAQCWKYVSELLREGIISRETKVTCFVLGDSIDPIEKDARKENNDNCIIQPMDYNIVIARAKSRLLRLYDRVKGAPFIDDNRKKVLTRSDQTELLNI
ncbi:ATP-binding protein [bacterium 19CA06SA08-2]|uniref:ATP-binding protein n=1 Tax=bacterium 19CA06SA08-2 TaxID=2920658 RepID=A0AAU6U167_UNCXX